MPATFPSSFASAAAGNSSDPASRRTSGRGDSGGFGEWGRRPNGATQTFRRPSLATANSQTSHHRDMSASVLSPSTSSGGAYVPPHISASRNGAQSDARLSRDYLLELFKHHRNVGDLDDDLSDLFMGDFEPDTPATSAARWNRREELATEPPIKPDICLNTAADTEPLGLLPMTAEEHEVFATSVNSPLKAPNPSAARDGIQREGPGLRKLSMSHTHGLSTVTSPTTSRPMNRRREPSDTFSRDQLTSPTSTRFGRDDGDSGPPPALLRRKTDGRDVGHGRLEEQDEGDEPSSMGSGPFGLSRRVTTGPLSAGVNGPQSPWSQPSSGGAFGSFSLSNGSGARRPGGGLVRGESRFKGLMNRDSVESTRSPVQEKPSHGSLNRAGEYRDDVDQQSGDNLPVGSAALGGAAHDESHGRHPGRTVEGQGLHDLDTSEALLGASSAGQPFGQPAEEPNSPTSTNPYQSPEREPARLNDMGPDDIDLNNLHLPGLGSYHQAENSGSTARGLSSFESRPFERPSTLGGPAVTRGFPGLGSIGALPAVSSPGGWGTPGRERAFDNFGDSSFRQDSNAPPALSGLGSIGPFSSGSRTAERSGNAIGSSRLGSLFPTAMQEQLRGAESSKFRQPSTHDLERSEEPFEAFSARAQAQGFSQATVPGREMESPFYANRTHDIASTSESSPAQASQRLQPIGSQTNLAKLQSTDQSQQTLGGANLPPAAQQKTMVMPDRIRWIYRDPQGNTQGPWSGLEMHDWYRAGFFSPELLVKKAEDPDYEPLAQLIRRIGNSREPFLVPQIGIPGPPSSAASGAWPPPAATQQPPPSSGGAQPPFASSFPTFGTTLTAEQQNALERRKQEEQYLMARQKEHLAQQQIYHRMQMQTQGFPNAQQQQPQSLQHHSSAQSLQSQQSLGSIGSPPTYPSGTNQGLSGGFEGSLRPSFPGAATDSLSHIEEEQPTRQPELARHHDQQYAEPSDHQQTGAPEQSIAASIADRTRLAQEQAAFDQNQGLTDDQSYDSSRLDEFHSLRNETSMDESQNFRELIGRFGSEQQAQVSERGDNKGSGISRRKGERVDDDQIGPVGRGLTLTEQVQKAASAKISSPTSGNQSPWAKVDKPVVDSHPASQTSSPLPAPAARRSGGQSVADALAADTASQRNSPVVDTPTTSVAPWARETIESQKQPSLKEIQEAEAKRAAKQEEVAAAMRRAALEKELATQATAPAPGLPSSSTWASGDTSMSPSASSASAWAKPSIRKSGTVASSSAKKTLQQIQKEEEALARRQKALAGATTSSSNLTSAPTGASQAISSGKRYADLASRTAQAASPPSGPWTTVGASGKTKAPSTGLPSTLNRTASGSAAAPVTGASRPKPAPTPGRTTSGSVAPSLNAQDEFKKWAVGELRPDLKKGILVDEFVGSLLNLPSDTDLITEAVHSASSTMDSRHFAEEFVKRRALADKGKTQPPSGSSSLSQPTGDGKGSGWSEVASRKPAAAAGKEESTSGFKVVPAKKKAGKR